MSILKCVAYLAAIGVLSHFIGQALPRSWFNADRPPYRAFAWERGGAIYDKLRIRSWKDKLPDMSKFMPDMVPKKVSGTADAASVDLLIRETCVAELIHILLIIAGFFCVFIKKGIGGVIISTLWALGNIPFILIQRYNRPRMRLLFARLKKRERAVD